MKTRIFILIVLLLFTMAGCNFEEEKITSITISGDTTIEVGEVKPLDITFDPAGLKGNVLYSSSDENILIVEEDGYITGIGAGSATITVKLKDDESINDSIVITVIEAELESLSILGQFEMYVDSTLQLGITTVPSHASKNVIWESDNTEAATVDENGLVTGVGMGIVEIKATSISNPEIFAVHRINVNPNSSTNFTINGPKVVDVNSEVKFTATANDVDISQHFEWESLNEEIATINSLGLFKALSAGQVTIKVTSKFNSALSKEIIVNVVSPEYIYQKTRILTIDRSKNYVEFFNVSATKVDSETRYLKLVGKEVSPASFNDLYVGMENVYVEYKKNTDVIKSILIDGEAGYTNIRVGIRKTINDISVDATRFHDSIDLTLYQSARIQTFDNTDYVDVDAGNLNITIVDGKMIVTSNSQTILESNKRIIIIPTYDNEAIRISSIARGSNETYSGNLEVSLYLGRMLIVNDINLEKYLYKVVPSEMPASYHAEALKAQAVAARTYAYRDILNRTFEKYGYTVDDSVQSQVYNNGNQQTNSTNAVNQTKGLIMMHDGELVNAFYYSTSAGITASAHEVWISDSNPNPSPTPYLMGQNHTKDSLGNIIQFDYTNEENMLNFFKTRNVYTPDNTVGYHRWKVAFTKSQLTTTISKNLTLRYAATPNLVLTKSGDKFVSLPISTNIGSVENIYVGKRGTSGVVIELIIETTTNTYKLINQYNIRFTLRPGDAGTSNYTSTATSADYTKSGSNSILFSGFFAIEEVNGTFTFFGGGNGHGVGMSQNGANSLGKSGMKYDEILSSYYSQIDLTDISYEYTDLPFFKDYFYK